MMDLYHERNTNLRAIGFRSYGKYLQSTLWRRIKRRVLRVRGCVCVRCGDEGCEIHHADYDVATLAGKKLGSLIVLCRECHEYIEFESGQKVSLARANERLSLQADGDF